MKCWTCGTDIARGLAHTCSELKEQKQILERLEYSAPKTIYEAVEVLGSDLARISETFEGDLFASLYEIASILEWNFEEIQWKLEHLGGTLRSIDRSLKSPSQTRATEWRQMAEDLRRRGVLDESEKFFLKSLQTNPLDYRTYVGLGKTYCQMQKLDKAKSFWEKSLPHAPKREIDYKSYSYRLIGRVYFCQDNPRRAASILKTAIELSPNFYLGHYDYAQYCALIGD